MIKRLSAVDHVGRPLTDRGGNAARKLARLQDRLRMTSARSAQAQPEKRLRPACAHPAFTACDDRCTTGTGEIKRCVSCHLTGRWAAQSMLAIRTPLDSARHDEVSVFEPQLAGNETDMMFITPVDALAAASLWCNGRGSTRAASNDGQCHLPRCNPVQEATAIAASAAIVALWILVTYRIYSALSGSNSTLSARISSFEGMRIAASWLRVPAIGDSHRREHLRRFHVRLR